jgi:hypothetical protein
MHNVRVVSVERNGSHSLSQFAQSGDDLGSPRQGLIGESRKIADHILIICLPPVIEKAPQVLADSLARLVRAIFELPPDDLMSFASARD